MHRTFSPFHSHGTKIDVDFVQKNNEKIIMLLTSFLSLYFVYLNEDEEFFKCRLCSERCSEFISDLEETSAARSTLSIISKISN